MNEAQYSIWRPTQKIRQLHSIYQSKGSMISLKGLASYFRRFNCLPKLSDNVTFGSIDRKGEFYSFYALKFENKKYLDHLLVMSYTELTSLMFLNVTTVEIAMTAVGITNPNVKIHIT